MASTNATADDNRVYVLLAESSTTPGEFEPVQVDPATGAIMAESA